METASVCGQHHVFIQLLPNTRVGGEGWSWLSFPGKLSKEDHGGGLAGHPNEGCLEEEDWAGRRKGSQPPSHQSGFHHFG